eukprot:1152991-Pelagomonas_calceolata.AAC.3
MPLVRSRSLAAPGVVLKAWKGSGQYLLWGGDLLYYWARSNEVNCCDPEFTASSSINVCLWVSGIDVKGGLVVEVSVKLSSSRSAAGMERSGSSLWVSNSRMHCRKLGHASLMSSGSQLGSQVMHTSSLLKELDPRFDFQSSLGCVQSG